MGSEGWGILGKIYYGGFGEGEDGNRKIYV